MRNTQQQLMPKHFRLLVVGDDRPVLAMLKRALANARVKATISHCSELGELFAHLESRDFDCVLANCSVAASKKTNLIKALRNADINAPVIAIADNEDEKGVSDWIAAGALDYLRISSMSEEHLVRRLRHATRIHRAESNAALVYEKLRLAASVIESTTEGIFVTDGENDIHVINPAFTQLTGYLPGDIVGTSITTLAAGEEPTLDESLWNSIRRRGRWQGELWIRHRDGHVFPIGISVSRISGPEDNTVQHVAVFNDISEQRQSSARKEFFATANALLTASLDYASVLPKIAKLVVSNRISDCCWIYLFDENHSLSEVAASGAPIFSAAATNYGICNALPEMVQPFGSMEFRLLALGDDALKPSQAQLLKKAGLSSCLSCPLFQQGEVIGMLIFATNDRSRTLGSYESGIATELARQLGVFLENARLYEKLSQFKTTLDATSDCIFIWDSETLQFCYANQGAIDLLGYPEEELLGMKISQIRPDFHYEELQRISKNLAYGKNPTLTIEQHIRQKNGSEIPVEVHLQYIPINEQSGQYIAIIRDVSERKRAEQKIEHMAYYDPLTNLPNRTLLHKRLQSELEHAKVKNELMAVLFVDLDRFKVINDTLGHAIGDKLLQGVAERLSGCVREGDFVARLGGDEFTILVPSLGQMEHAARVAEKIVDALQAPFYYDNHELHVTPSIGISVYPNDGSDGTSLLKNADIALYRAKNNSRNTFQFYTPALNPKALERLILENSLRHALARKEFMVYYQPKVQLNTRRIVGAEALIRWHHPTLGIIAPSEFIPLAEETGLIVAIDEWVMATACEQIATWQKDGLPPLKIAVNVTHQQIKQETFPEKIGALIEEFKIDPGCLELELTENIIMDNPEEMIRTLQEIKRLGVQFSIDDFGTGYSSLSHLKRFPIDTVKIDQSFIRECINNIDDAAIITAIVSMSHSLNLEVIAEGIETAEQLDFLHSLRCDAGQGFAFSPPIPAHQFAKLIEQSPQLTRLGKHGIPQTNLANK